MGTAGNTEHPEGHTPVLNAPKHGREQLLPNAPLRLPTMSPCPCVGFGPNVCCGLHFLLPPGVNLSLQTRCCIYEP
jgi:hypothetical protein